MLIDAARFPLVWMRMSGTDDSAEGSPFAPFDALLARREVFVLLNDEGLDNGSHDHSPEMMKQITRWMKRNKNQLRAFVKAAVYIEPSSEKRLENQAFAVVYQKFWGYPMLMAATRDEALDMARTLLADGQAATPASRD